MSATNDPRSAPGLIVTAVKRPIAVLMIVLAVAVFGAVSLGKLPVNLLPDVSYPTLTVRTEYEGAAPADIEKLVTRRIEETLAVVANLVHFRSVSRAGVSDVILEFEWKTPMTFAAQDVREKVDQVLPRLPEGTKRPLILRYDPALDPVLRIALVSDGDQDLEKLRTAAEEELRRRLESIPGVAAVRARGGFEEEWRLELEEDLLKLHGVGADAVIERVGLENANVAGGTLRDGDRESVVRTLGEIETPEELADLVVANRGGRPVKIRELGRVVTGHKDRDVVTRIDGKESVEIEIFKEAGANAVQVCNAVKTRLFGPEWRKRLSAGNYLPAPPSPSDSRGPRKEPILADALLKQQLRLRVLSDQSVFIERSIGEVQDAAIQGALLAIVILFAFLRRLGPTLIIGVSIPVSILATFAPLYLAGTSLNVMSLGGLALGVGMLVDASIVVLEVVTRHREEGRSALDAAILGTREVAGAVTSSALTTIAVFLPIVFVEGVAGEFFRDQAIVVVFSLVASLVAAIFFIPTLAARSFAPKRGAESLMRVVAGTAGFRGNWIALRGFRDAAGMLRQGPGLPRRVAGLLGLVFESLVRLPAEAVARLAGSLVIGAVAVLALTLSGLWSVIGWLLRGPLHVFDRAYAGLEGLVRLLLAVALRARLLVLAGAVALSVLAVQRIPRLGIELMPTVHQGEFTVENQLDVDTPVERTDVVGAKVTDAVRAALDDAGVEVAGLSSVAGVDRTVIAKAGDGNHTSRVHVLLAARAGIAAEEDRAVAAIRERLRAIPDLREPVFVRPTLFSTRTALEVEVVGEALPAVEAAAGAIEEALRGIPGLTDIQSTRQRGRPELVVRPDRGQLAFYDLTAGSVANVVRNKVQGKVSTRIARGDRKIDVLVRAPRDDVKEREAILALQVNPAGTTPIPLSAVAAVAEQPGPSEIRRVAGERAVILSAAASDLDLEGAAAAVEAEVERLRNERPALLREVVVRIGGQREESQRSLRSLLFALAIAVFLVYIIMAAQFESLHHPFVILFTIPLALVGVVFALEWAAIKISIVVLLGAILLVGIVVNNAIVLIDCVNQRRRSGVSRDQALFDSVRLRLRPILMTTLTTVLGLLPMALASGEGHELQRPMAVTVIAGLGSSTILTLVVIPIVYSLVTRPGPLASAETPE